MRITQHRFEDVLANVYFMDAGEIIPRHQHPFMHTTSVAAGRAEVKIWDAAFTIDIVGDVMLPANIDHEIRALEDGTIVINMQPASVVGATIASPGQTGGIAMADGTVIHDP